MNKLSNVYYNRNLRKIIFANQIYSMDEIKNILMENDELEIVKSMLNWLCQYMNAFNYSSNSYKVLRIFDYLKGYSSSDLEPIGNFVHEYIKNLKIRTEILIKRKTNDSIVSEQIELLLYDFSERLDAFDISFTYNLKTKYNDNLYKFIKYIAFDIKSIDFLKEIFKRWPNVVNTVNKKKKTIFEISTKRFLEEVMCNPENRNQLVYYSELIKTLMLAPQFRVDDEVFNNIREKMYCCLDELPSDNYQLNIARIEWLRELELILKNPKKKKTFIDNAKYYGIMLTNDLVREDQQEYRLLLRAREIALNNLKYQTEVREKYNNYILSIDSVDTLDVDDCLSIEELSNGNKLLGVHISDPLAYLPYNSYFTNLAKYKAETIYLNNTIIPMYPIVFSNNLMSLLPNSDKLTNSYFFEISSNGIEKFYCKKMVINNSCKTSYGDVNKSLKKGSEDYLFDSVCYQLSDLSSKIQFGNKTTNYIHGKTLERNKSVPTDAELMIMKLMLLTNSNAAKLAKNKQIPFLYRSHKIETVEKKEISRLLTKLRMEKDKLNGNQSALDVEQCLKLENLLRQITPSATYELDGAHDGLGTGEKEYCHITSPIRRFADVINNHCFNIAIFNTVSDRELIFLEAEVKAVKDILNNQIKLNKQFVLSLGQGVDKRKK